MIPYIIIALSIIVWFLPLFRQKRTEFFLFFLILASSDPLIIIFHQLNLFHGQQLIVIFELLAFYALIKRTILNKIAILILSLIIVFAFENMTSALVHSLSAVIQTLILITIIYKFMLFINNRRVLSLFYIILICYQTSVIFKMVAVVIDVKFGIVQFYLTSFLQIFFGVLFTFINLETKNFRILKEMDADYNQE